MPGSYIILVLASGEYEGALIETQKTATVQVVEVSPWRQAWFLFQGMLDYCQAQRSGQLVETAKREYSEPKAARTHLATAKVLKRGGYDWSRIQQCIEFAKELGVTKVGLAVCVGLVREGREFARFLTRAGFEVVSVACMIGAVEAQETRIPDK